VKLCAPSSSVEETDVDMDLEDDVRSNSAPIPM